MADDPPTDRRRPFQIMVIVLVFAAAARFYGIGASSFWLDEFCSLEAAAGHGLSHVALPRDELITNPPLLTSLEHARPWWTIWTSMQLDNHPPLYFLLLRFWIELFGTSEAAARSLSILPSLAAIVFLYIAVREQRGQEPALWAVALMTIAMPQIHYAQETRGYSLLIAATCAAIAATSFIESRGTSRARLIALTAAALVMLLTHYFAIAPLIAIGIYALIRFRERARNLTIIALITAAIIYAIIWGPFLLQQRTSVATNNAWQLDPAPYHFLRTLERAAQVPLRLLIETYKASLLSSVYIVFGVIALALPLFFLRRRKDLLIWYLCFVTPIAFVVAIDLVRHARHTGLIRYTIVAGPALCALIAFTSSWSRKILPLLLLLACLYKLPHAHFTDTGWITLADTLDQFVKPSDTVIYASAGGDDWYASALYLGVSHYAPALSSRAPIMLIPRALTSPPSFQNIWLVTGPGGVPPEKIIPGATPVDAPLAIPDVGVLYHLALTPAPYAAAPSAPGTPSPPNPSSSPSRRD